MPRVERSALVPYSCEQMFNVVLDVEAYPSFLPWCSGARVLEQHDSVQVGELELSRAGMTQRFATLNRLVFPSSITLELVSGPFRKLSGEWRFVALGDAGCKVELTLSFELDGRVMKVALGQLWRMAADRMVDAFCERAGVVYG